MNDFSTLSSKKLIAPSYIPVNRPLKIFEGHLRRANRHSCYAQVCTAFFIFPIFTLFVAHKYSESALIQKDQDELNGILAKLKEEEKSVQHIAQMTFQEKRLQLQKQVKLVQQSIAEMQEFQSRCFRAKYDSALKETLEDLHEFKGFFKKQK